MLTIGDHRVETKSIHKADFNRLLKGQQADVLWTDPPWSDRMMSYFGTLKEKQTNREGTNINYEKMLRTLATVVRDHVDGVAIIAAAMDDDTTETIVGEELYNLQTQIAEYRGSEEMRKYKWLLGGTEPHYSFDGNISMMSSQPLADKSVEIAQQREGGILLDPMCGQGTAAVAALRNGMTFVGNEFNAKRANETADKIQAIRGRQS